MVRNMDLNSIELFVRVVQQGSFSAASRHTGVPVATVSRRVSELERSLDVRLLERSTRQLRLTGAGSTLYEYVSRGLQEMDAGALALQNRESELRGTLRLSMPPNFSPWWDLLRDFQEKFPHIELDIYATERKIDLIEDGIDVSLRIGDVIHLSAVARKLMDYRHVMVATPQFIQSFGQPKSPQDLLNYPIAVWGKKEDLIDWVLNGEKVSIKPTVSVNDYLHLRYLALQNIYITELPPFVARDLIAQKRLVQILPDYKLPQYSVSLLYQSRHQLSRIARVYIDFCKSNAESYLLPNS
ncbi:MAG: LysR substrate-binding domain-containing protein [Woeseiaceae bacterium]